MSRTNQAAGFLSTKRLEKGPWQAFERAISRLFFHQGWPDVSLVGGVGDQGADIIVSDNKEDRVIQAKFRDGQTIGKDIIKDVKRAMEFYGIDIGIAATNVRLSTRANEYLGDLNGSGYEIYKLEGRQLIDTYNNLPQWPEGEFTPHVYQVRALDSLWDKYKRGQGSALLSLATGLGKTYVAGMLFKRMIMEDPRKRILVLANQRPLIKQFEMALWKHLPKEVSTHLWYGGEKPSYNQGVTIATFQTVKGILEKGNDLSSFDVVVVDEAHHAPASSYREVIEEIGPSFLLGLTATPWRGDKRTLHDLFGPPTPECTVDIVQALRNGYLSQVDYRLLCDNIDWGLVQSESGKRYTIRDLNKRLFIEERDDAIIEKIEEAWKEIIPRRAIIYCASIGHAKRMEALLRERGYTARCLQSYQDTKENERRLREFRKGNIKILTAMNMLNEGVDVPEVEIIVFLRVTHSRIIFLQQLGRGLRVSPGKEKVVVMDFVADIKRIAETLEIDSGVSRQESDISGEDVEILNSRFNVTFSSNKAQSFFEEYLKDKAEVQTKSQEERLIFP